MEYPGVKVQSQLTRLKKCVELGYKGFESNYDMFNQFKSFVYKSSLDAADLAVLEGIGRPELEFNVLPAYIARLKGEFSKQEPALEVIADDPDKVDPAVITMVDHMLHYEFNDSSNEHLKYDTYDDMLSGGWSVMKVTTEYAHEMSMDQVIKITRPFDVTLCGFDPLAQESHKGDGQFCFELRVVTKEEFKEENPGVDLTRISFRTDLKGFKWSYANGQQDLIIIAQLYEKKKKRVKLVRLDNGKTMPKDEYKKLLKDWQDPFSLPPSILNERTTHITKIHRYKFIENKILEEEETDLPGLPLVLFVGTSAVIKNQGTGKMEQLCLPYVYHAKDAQRLKNFAGISLANELENVLQHKFSVAIEALPIQQPDWLEAYTNIQKSNVIVHKTRYDDNPDQLIPNPVVQLQKMSAPPEIIQAFQGTDSLIQQILGSYDAALGINDNQLSGVAVVEAATQSNSAAMPYVVGFMQGLQRVGQLFVELLPKYVTTPRTIPLIDEKGQRYFKRINENNEPTFNYESNSLQVHLKAGASFQVQKAKTLKMVQELMSISPVFQQFIAEKGLNFVLDNMEGKGIEQLKKMVDEFVGELDKQKQMAQQAQMQEMQSNPQMMKMQLDQQKMQNEMQESQAEHQLKMAEIHQKYAELDAKMLMTHNRDRTEIEKAHIANAGKIAQEHVKQSYKKDSKGENNA